MITLAIELSTDQGSLALLEADRLLYEGEWVESRLQRQQFFAALGAAVESGDVRLPAVDLFAVGLGPGAFAGLRAAVSAACALALPGGRPVFGLSSSEALAFDVMKEMPVDLVTVFGDARRDQLWAARYERSNGWPQAETPWTLMGFDHVAQELSSGRAAWVTADWDRIGEHLRRLCPPNDLLIEGRRIPHARSVGILAARKTHAGVASEPLAPHYVHPPVSVPPRFEGLIWPCA